MRRKAYCHRNDGISGRHRRLLWHHGSDRGERLAQTFFELAGILVTGFDLMEHLPMLTGRCAGLLEADAAGLVLAARRARPRS